MSENNKSEHIGADAYPSPKKSIKKKIFKRDQWYPSAALSIGIANRKEAEAEPVRHSAKRFEHQ
jgi:hypothetical protein